MADPVQIQNKEEIAEEIGNNLSGSLKKIFEKMSSDQERIASVQKILNLEDKREKAVRDKALLDAIKGIKLDVKAIERKDSASFLEMLGLGGLFSVLAGITATVGGITVGLGTDGALFRSSDLRKAFDNFKVKFPKFADDVTDFFNIGDDISEATKIATKAESVSKMADSKVLAKLVNNPMSELVTKVFGRVFSIAGNPVFDAIAMGKDAFDIFDAKTDKDVRTNVLKEDVFAIIGGFLGGAIGAIGGPAGVALGVGLGNMAGEFVGSLMDEPEIIATIDKVKKDLEAEKKTINDTIKKLSDELLTLDPNSEYSKVVQGQIDAEKKRLGYVTDQLKDFEPDSPMMKARQELINIGKEGDDIAKEIEQLELALEKAEDEGLRKEKVRLLTKINDKNDQLDLVQEKYDKQELEVRKLTEGTGAVFLDQLNTFDRLTVEGGLLGMLVEGLGIGGVDPKAMRGALEARKSELQMMINEHVQERKRGNFFTTFGFKRGILIKDLEGEIGRVQRRINELPELHSGGRITKDGAIVAQKGEVIIDDVLVKGLEHSINFLAESARMMRESGSPVVINNVNNSQTNPVISNQATTVKVPDAVRSGEPSFGMAARAMMMN